MIMFFDILLLDDDVCLAKPHRLRRLLLQDVVETIHGRAGLAEQEVLDFSRAGSYRRLERSFEKAIAQRWEGYVLKGSDEPYFPIYSAGVDHMFGRWIKLKKDYIPGLGDTLDLALIGANYNCKDAPSLGQIEKLKWTHFLVGCLLNKEDIQQRGAVPHFQAVDLVGRNSMSVQVMQRLNQFGEFYARQHDNFEGFHVKYDCENLPIATALFKHPFIVEMLGSGFEKPSGARYFSLRFPRILKIYSDRTLEDAVSFQEMQRVAEGVRSLPADELKEREQWSERLKVGSERNQYIMKSASPEATCSDTDDEPFNSPSQVSHASQTATTSGDSVMETSPLMEGLLEDSIGAKNLGGSQDDSSIPPVVYIDETIIITEAENSVPENSILAENKNLSSRQESSQKNGGTVSQKSKNFPRAISPEKPHRPASCTLSRSMQISSFTSAHDMHSQETQEPRTRLLGRLAAPTSTNQKRKISPQSPITTIPIWAPITSLGSFTFPQVDDPPDKDTEHHDLCDFLRSICSDTTTSLIEQSNPYAASQGTRFGIVIFDPKATLLGEEMHRFATTLSSAVHVGTTSVPSMGSIFFLGSSMLDRAISPEDLRFCLRDTWKDIGRHDYYGRLSWDLKRRSDSKLSQKANSHSESDWHYNETTYESSQRQCSEATSPWITISFDETDIAVLGEYTSIEPLAHRPVI